MHDNAPEEAGFPGGDVQPRLADSSTPFRARASSTPYLRTKEEFSSVLPETQFGASAGASLQVVGLGGLFCHDSLFFRGLCETPQANEIALFRHPVVKAGVLVQWQGYAEVRGWDRYVKLQGETHSRLKLWKARSRLYRRRFLQPNTHFSAFFEIYKIIIPSHRSDLKIC